MHRAAKGINQLLAVEIRPKRRLVADGRCSSVTDTAGVVAPVFSTRVPHDTYVVDRAGCAFAHLKVADRGTDRDGLGRSQ
jgi:hypothetical protein